MAQRSIVAFVLATALGWAASAGGQPPSAQSFSSGVQLLGEGRFEAAAGDFQAAIAADSSDAQSHFFLGVTWNRLDRPAAALAELQKAKDRGNDNPDLPFEMGWSLVMLHDWARAVPLLEAYQRTNPSRGQASEFLGRAYLGLRRYDDARVAFDRAVKLDPDLKLTVDIYRAELGRTSGNAADAANLANLNLVVLEPNGAGPAGGLGGRYGALSLTPTPLAQPPALPDISNAATTNRWQVFAALGGGYDTNARALEANLMTIVAKPAADGAASAFAQLNLDASYRFVQNSTLWLTGGIDLFERAYLQQGVHADYFDPQVYLQLDEIIAPSLTGSLTVSDDYTLVDYGNFRNQLGARTALEWDVSAAFRLEGAYSYANNHYLYTFPGLGHTSSVNPGYNDANADAHTVSALISWSPAQSHLKLRGGFSHTWNLATGSDYDFTSNTFLSSVAVPLPWQINAEIGFDYTIERYLNYNEQTFEFTTPKHPRHQHDSISALTVRFTRPVAPHLSSYLEYDYNRDDSNLAFYAYNQNVIGAGLIWSF